MASSISLRSRDTVDMNFSFRQNLIVVLATGRKQRQVVESEADDVDVTIIR
jgi:hypothetical protein